MTRVAVFLQTGFLSPYPVALLAAHASCLILPCSYFPTLLQFGGLRPAICISISKKKILWTPVFVAPPPLSSADPHCWRWADGVPLPPIAADISKPERAAGLFVFAVSPLIDVRCLLLNRSTRRPLFLGFSSRQEAALGGDC